MARYQYDEEWPDQRYYGSDDAPASRVSVSRFWFASTLLLATIGAIFLLMIVFV